MIQRLLTTTVFPYTTLFRSGHAAMDDGLIHRLIGIIKLNVFPNHSDAYPVLGRNQFSNHILPMAHVGRDRKSTRLNSSHLVISYAVSCLTKKNRLLPQKTIC